MKNLSINDADNFYSSPIFLSNSLNLGSGTSLPGDPALFGGGNGLLIHSFQSISVNQIPIRDVGGGFEFNREIFTLP